MTREDVELVSLAGLRYAVPRGYNGEVRILVSLGRRATTCAEQVYTDTGRRNGEGQRLFSKAGA